MTRPVRYGGVSYPSEDAARKALRISIGTIRGERRVKRRPVVIDGVLYASQAEAARALGVSRQAINQRGGDPREGFDIDF